MQHELIKYIAVVEAGSFTKAAKALRISQPALSMAIKQLETELGHELILRSSNLFSLTEAGKLVYESARQIKLEVQDLEQKLEESASTSAGLRAGLIDSVAEALFAQDLDGQILEEVTVDNSRRLIDSVRLDRLDTAIITQQLTPLPDGISHLELGFEPFSALTGPNNVKSIERAISRGQPVELLAYNPQSSTFALIEHYLQEHKIRFKPVFYSTDPKLLLKMIDVRPRAVTLVPSLIVNSIEQPTGEIDSLNFSRPIWSIQRQSRYQPESHTRLIDAVKNYLT